MVFDAACRRPRNGLFMPLLEGVAVEGGEATRLTGLLLVAEVGECEGDSDSCKTTSYKGNHILFALFFFLREKCGLLADGLFASTIFR